MRASIQSARLRRILSAYAINELGTWLGYVALTVGVYHHTKSALAVAGLLVAGRLLPAIATPAVVARVEKSGRRGSLTRLYLVEAVATAGLVVLLADFFLGGIFLLVAVDGAAAFAANALLRAAVAQVAAEEIDPATPAADVDMEVALAQRRANAALNLTFTVTVATGPALAGVVVAAAGASAALTLDALSFALCGLLLIDVFPAAEISAEASVRARLMDAWLHVRNAADLRLLLLAESFVIVFFASAEPVEVVYAVSTLRVGYQGFGLLLAVWGVGMVGGGILFARLVHRPLGPMLVLSTLAVGLSYVGFSVAPTLAVACAAAALGGVGNGVQWAALISSVQRLTPQELHGRLMGVVESIRWLCPAIGALLGGALVAALGSPRQAFLVAGLVAVASTGLFVRISLSAKRLSARESDGAVSASPANIVPPSPTG